MKKLSKTILRLSIYSAVFFLGSTLQTTADPFTNIEISRPFNAPTPQSNLGNDQHTVLAFGGGVGGAGSGVGFGGGGFSGSNDRMSGSGDLGNRSLRDLDSLGIESLGRLDRLGVETQDLAGGGLDPTVVIRQLVDQGLIEPNALDDLVSSPTVTIDSEVETSAPATPAVPAISGNTPLVFDGRLSSSTQLPAQLRGNQLWQIESALSELSPEIKNKLRQSLNQQRNLEAEIANEFGWLSLRDQLNRSYLMSKSDQQATYESELARIKQRADELIDNDLWENSQDRIRYGHILNYDDPATYSIDEAWLNAVKSTLASYNIPEEDWDKHIVGNPTTTGAGELLHDVRTLGGIGLAKYGPLASVLLTREEAGISGLGLTSAAVLIPQDRAQQQADGSWVLESTPARVPVRNASSEFPLCEPTVSKIIKGAFCSGFLASIEGEQRYITANHCISQKGRSNWSVINVAFGYAQPEPNDNLAEFDFLLPADHVYRFKRMTHGPIALNTTADDFAVFELDREVPAHVAVPVELDLTSERTPTQLVALVSYPSGFPLSVDLSDTEPRIEEVIDDYLLRVSTDSNHGSSGGMVLNAVNGKALAILVSGRPDYFVKTDEAGDGCAEPVRTEELTKAGEFAVDVKRIFDASL